MNAYNLIVSEMEKYTKKSLSGKTRVLINCPWHKDSTPSLAVTLQEGKGKPGQYTCFACRANSRTHGGWNGLAEKLGLLQINGTGYLEEWKGAPVDSSSFLSESTHTWESLEKEWHIAKSAPISDTYSFRGIESWLLQKIHARAAIDDFGHKCTLLPVMVGAELVGGIKAINHPTASTKRKYLNASGTWSSYAGLFPLQARKKWPFVVLVEGPRDALVLLQRGIPALAILGTHSWSVEKRSLLLSLEPDYVLVAGDGDNAGAEMNSVILKSLKGYVPRKKVPIPKGEDPASLPKSFWRDFL